MVGFAIMEILNFKFCGFSSNCASNVKKKYKNSKNFSEFQIGTIFQKFYHFSKV